MNENRCLYVTKEHTAYLRVCDIPHPNPDEVIVQTKATGICGSDIHFYKDGRLGNFILDKPYIPGHESSGVIYAVGEQVKGLRPGQRVVIEPGIPCRTCSLCSEGRYNICENLRFMSGPICDGTFRNYFPIRSDLVHPLPDSMSYEMGALVEPTAVALHVLNRAGHITGRSLAIMGAGPIGLLVGMAYKALGGGQITCIDLNQERLDRARQLCADEVLNPAQSPLPENYAQVVIETAGSPVTTAQLFQIAATGARVVQVGWVKGNLSTLDIALLIAKELDYVGSIDYANEFPAAIYLLSKGRIDASALVTHRFQFQDAPAALEFTASHPSEVLKTIVSFEDTDSEGGVL